MALHQKTAHGVRSLNKLTILLKVNAMGLLNLIFGMEDIKVDGKMHVGTFQKKFKDAFGTEIRVYKSKADGTINSGKGAKSAPTKSTLASNCAKGQKVGDLTIKKSKIVGDIETEFAKKMGIGIQIMLPDGSGFADNNMRLKDVAKAV